MILIKLQILRRMLIGVKIWCQALSNILHTLTDGQRAASEVSSQLAPQTAQSILESQRRSCQTFIKL